MSGTCAGSGDQSDVRIGEGVTEMSAETLRQHMFPDWNATRTQYPRNRTIHSLFEEQAARCRTCRGT